MIFVFTAVIMVVMLAWRLRDLRLPEPLVRMPAAMTALALVLGGYGIALLAIPEDATSFWPWPVDAFHARIYAATYLTPAVGALVIRRGGTSAEIRTLAATMIVSGVGYDGGTWAFFAVNVAPVLAGVALLRAARAGAPVATPA